MTNGFGVALGGFFTNEARTPLRSQRQSEILVTHLILRTILEQ
jgi:hypothetical protein